MKNNEKKPKIALAGGVTNAIGLVINSANPLLPANGGTGVNNGSNTITLAGTFATSGANALTLTTTGATNVTLPTSGTLITSAVTSLPNLTSAASLATVGTITTGTWNATVINPTYGGTGVNNGSNTITLAGTFATVGANALTLTTTGATNVTLPTSGTLITSAVTSLPNLTSAASLATVGTITTGTWNGSVINPTYGGTGVNNGSNTITLAGTFATSGANALTLTTTGATNVTLPTSGTLVTAANSVVATSVTSNTFTMTSAAAINVFTIDNATPATQVQITLPASPSIGQVFKVIGISSGGWQIKQTASQQISYQSNGAVTTTTAGTGGSLTSTLQNDCIELVCTATSPSFLFTAAAAYGSSITGV